MEIILETEEKKILSETVPYADECTYTNTVTLLNIGDHATHRIRDTYDNIPEIWKPTELSMLDTRNGENVETKAEFLYRAMAYQGDSYKPLRTMIRMQNAEQTVEDRRIIFYDDRGAVEKDMVVVLDLTNPKAKFNMGGITYVLDTTTDQYVSETGAIYQGMINNDGILDKVNMLAEQAEKMVVEKPKSL